MKYDFLLDMNTDNAMALILKRIRPGTKVLEFGTATGYMTRYLREELGCEVYGVEIDADAARLASPYCRHMIVADLDMLTWREQLAGHVFEHLLFVDVLEHLRDPWRVLQEAAAFLQPDGTLITSIPNIGHDAVVMSLLRGNFDYHSTGLLDDGHIRFFTRQSVVKLLDSAGLCPIEWLTTRILPEHTELKQTADTFTAEMRALLRNRSDGHTYQFITVSQKREAVPPDKQMVPFIYEGEYLNDEYVQVYWNQDGVYQESDSVKVKLYNQPGTWEYEIVIPAAASGQLRLDPVNYPAYIEIDKIELILQDQVSLNVSEVIPNNGTIVIEDTGTWRMFCTTSDPQLLLANSVITASEQPKILRLSMKADTNLASYIEQALAAKESQWRQATTRAVATEAEVCETRSGLINFIRSMFRRKR